VASPGPGWRPSDRSQQLLSPPARTFTCSGTVSVEKCEPGRRRNTPMRLKWCKWAGIGGWGGWGPCKTPVARSRPLVLYCGRYPIAQYGRHVCKVLERLRRAQRPRAAQELAPCSITARPRQKERPRRFQCSQCPGKSIAEFAVGGHRCAPPAPARRCSGVRECSERPGP